MKKPKKIKTRAAKSNFDLTTGYLVATEFEANGGVTYDRTVVSEEEVGRGMKAEFITHKRVDDVELVRDSRSVVSRAYYIVHSICAHTPIGYFADPGALEALEKAFDEVRALARDFNDLARSVGSARRVKAEIYPLDVSVDNEHVAKRLAGLVHERLRGLHDSLRAGDLREYKQAAKRARNLEKLATGIQRDSIRYGLDCASDGRKTLAAAIKDENKPVPARGRVLDLEALEAAMAMFEEPEGAVLDARAEAEAEARA